MYPQLKQPNAALNKSKNKYFVDLCSYYIFEFNFSFSIIYHKCNIKFYNKLNCTILIIKIYLYNKNKK